MRLVSTKAQVAEILAKSYNPLRKQLILRSIHDDLERCKQWSQVVRSFNHWEDLQRLEIINCPATNDTGMRKFGIKQRQTPHLVSLRLGNTDDAVQLYNTFITVAGLRKLLNQTLLELKSLDFINGHFGDQTALVVIFQHMPVLQDLRLHNCRINGRYFPPTQFGKDDFGNLKSLWLNRNNLGLKGAKMITQLGFPSLEKLYLCECKIENEGLKFIAKGIWLNLKQLGLADGNIIGLSGFTYIVNNNWRKLQKLIYNEGSYEEQHGPLFLFCLLPSSWPNNLQIRYPNPSIAKVQLSEMLRMRFPQVKDNEQDTE